MGNALAGKHENTAKKKATPKIIGGCPRMAIFHPAKAGCFGFGNNIIPKAPEMATFFISHRYNR
jgi:hypothetical protein